MSKRKNSKFKKTVILLGLLLFVIVLAEAVILGLKIFNMNVLPTKYLLLLGGGIVFVLFLIILLTFMKKSPVVLRIFGVLIELACIAGFTIGILYLKKTVDFLNNMKNKLYQTEEYYLVTLKDSTLSSIDDIKNLEVGTYKDEINGNYNNAVIDMLDKQSILIYEYDDYLAAAQALIDKKVQVIFISAVYKVEVEDQIEKFYDDTKIIHTESLKIEAADIAKEVSVSKESFNIFISGIDSYGDISTTARSDVNMVVTVNPDTKEVLLTSIPRDYYVQLHGTTGNRDKLTHAGMYGVKMSVTTVEDLLGIDINYYVRVNFTTVKTLVNAIGGIEVNSPAKFTSKVNKNCTYKKGLNKVKGACALAFARERYAFEEGDNQRIKNQQEVIRAIVDKALQSKTIVSKYSKILESLGGSIETNMGNDKIYELIKMQLATMPTWDIQNQSLTGYDAYDYTYSLGHYEVYVMEPNLESVSSAKAKIKKVFNAFSEETATGK